MNKSERAARFRKVVRKITGDIVIFITQVDPDAVGSAVGVAQTIRHVLAGARWNGSITITYCGSVGHPQNLALFNEFALFERFVKAEDLEIGDNTTVVLVDSSLVQDSRMPASLRGLSPRLVIDHHRGTDLPKAGEHDFFWIDDEVGAASTLVAELARTTRTELTDATKVMLALGIVTDTKTLTYCDDRDREMYAWLTASAPSDVLARLIEYPLPASHFKHLGHALSSDNYQRHQSRVVAGAGIIRPEDGDVLSTIADDLIRQDGVSLVITWGVIDKPKPGESFIRISARSSGPGVSLNEFLCERFGHRTGAKFTAGRGEGGAIIPLEIVWLADEAIRAQVLQLWADVIARRVFDEEG